MKILTDPVHASLVSRATAWDTVVVALSPDDPATVTADVVVNHIRAAAESNSDRSIEIQQLTAELETRNSELAARNSELAARNSELEKRPGATPAVAVAAADPNPATQKPETGCLSGKESFIESLEKVAEWL